MTSRKFLLYNSEDDLVDLNNHEIFVLNPTGLGVSFSNSFSNVSANFLQEKSMLNSASLKLDIIFSRNSTTPYEKYEEFVKFLNKPPFKLIYEISGKTFQRDCVLSELSKGEIVTNVLTESLTLDFTTPFYKEIFETYKPNSDTEGDGKIYTGTDKPRNLIANPNFLNNMQDWANMSDPEGTYQLQVPACDKPNSNILKLTSSNNKLSSFRNAWGLLVKKGERISFRVDIKTENNPDYDRPVIRVVCGTSEKNYKYSDFGITSSSSDFETATISFIVPENGSFQLYLINQNLSTIGEMSTYFREPMLIRGDASDMPVEQYDDSYPNLNLLVNSSAKTKDGFFKNFDKVENGYGEVTIKGTNDWVFNDMWDGFTINPRDYKPDDIYTMSMDVMFTSWNLPAGTTLTEFWIGQRYSRSTDGSISSYKHICSIDLPRDPSNTLNQWIRITKTSTIPPYEDPAVNVEAIFMTKFTGASEGSFTVRVRKPKQEQGSTATPHMPSASEVKPTDYPSYVPGFYEGKQVYDSYVYPYVYESDYNGKSGVFQIENNSVYIGSAKGSPVEITVHGPCTNPYWEILDGSKVLQSDGYNIDVPDGYKLVVSSVVQKQRVKLIAPDGTISDVYQQQDLSKSNFVTIPEGHVTLAFHNVGDVSFNYREEYITV